jgi:hypothetical protein
LGDVGAIGFSVAPENSSDGKRVAMDKRISAGGE